MKLSNFRTQRFRRFALHVMRAMMFAAIILLVRLQHAEIANRTDQEAMAPIDTARLAKILPNVVSVAESNAKGRRDALDAAGKTVGYVIQTSPHADGLVGFSGPTNVLVIFSSDDRILGIDVIDSGDTQEHVDQILQDKKFLDSFRGLTWEDTSKLSTINAVSGATLTSLTIQSAIIVRLSGGKPSLKFPDPPTIVDAQQLFKNAAFLAQDNRNQSQWTVYDQARSELGSILLTSPSADNVVGYQGPTNTLIAFDVDGRCIGISIGRSYDNEPYVSYVRDEEYFLTLFNGMFISELCELDSQKQRIEGVSGATMTSTAVVEGLAIAARHHRDLANSSTSEEHPWRLNWALRDFGTMAIIACGLAIAMTPLRGRRGLGLCFQLVLIAYLGLVNGDMISLAMVAGWAKNSIPWKSAGGLLMLSAVAFVVPVTTRRNAYCTHLCPHGAAQHLLRNRLPWRWRIPSKSGRILKMIPAVLLLWCIVVAMANLAFSLVDIEPFDAWVFQVAGWATISVAIVGLLASLFVPMAYCRYGCPTGAVLGYLRFNSRSDRWSPRDSFAAFLVATALAMYWTV